MQRQWTESELADLEDTASGDWEHIERHPPVANAGARVCGRFSGEEFERVALAAERQGLKTTEFLRRLAIQAAEA